MTSYNLLLKKPDAQTPTRAQVYDFKGELLGVCLATSGRLVLTLAFWATVLDVWGLLPVPQQAAFDRRL